MQEMSGKEPTWADLLWAAMLKEAKDRALGRIEDLPPRRQSEVVMESTYEALIDQASLAHTTATRQIELAVVMINRALDTLDGWVEMDELLDILLGAIEVPLAAAPAQPATETIDLAEQTRALGVVINNSLAAAARVEGEA